MQSHSSISPVGSSTTLEQAIMLIETNQEDSFVALFNTDPDGMFAVPTGENVYFHSRTLDKENMLILIGRLSFQYIADKTSLEQWDKAAAFYLGVSRFKANMKQYFEARVNFEKAWFYTQKLAKQQGDTYDASNDVSLLKEWFSYAALEAESSRELDITEWGDIYYKILFFQQLTAIAIKIADRTQHPQDLQTVENCHRELAEIRFQFAEYFYQAAEKMKRTKKLLPLIDSRLRFALVNIVEAIALFKLTKGAEQKTFSIELKRELILGMRAQLKAKLNPEQQLASKNMQYEIGNLAENRNVDVEQVRSLIKDKVDINACTDFFGVAPGEVFESRETNLAGWIVAAGSIEVVKLIIEELGAKVWLFSTVAKSGLIRHLGSNSTPEVREYLFTPNERFYQIPEQKECVEFFQDALAGRLDNVKAKLKNNPQLIYEFPVIEDDEDESSEENVLHMACYQQQLHVVWYLEDFIASYMLTTKDYTALEKLFHGLMNCYEIYGWDERRNILVGNLKGTLLDLLDAAVIEFEKKPELTEAEQKEYSLCKFALLNVINAEAKKCEYDGEHSPATEKAMHYAEASAKYQLVIAAIFNPIFTSIGQYYEDFCNKLWDSQARVDKILDQLALSEASESEMDDDDEKKEEHDTSVLRLTREVSMSTQSWATTFQPASSTAIESTSNLVLADSQDNLLPSLRPSRHG